MTLWLAEHGRKIAVVFGTVSLAVAATANAQISTGIPPLTSPAAATTLLCNVMNAMFWVLLTVSIIMVLWGAWTYVTAGDDAKKPSEAKMIILYAIIGIVVAMAAKGFPTLVASVFPGVSSLHTCEVVTSGIVSP